MDKNINHFFPWLSSFSVNFPRVSSTLPFPSHLPEALLTGEKTGMASPAFYLGNGPGPAASPNHESFTPV